MTVELRTLRVGAEFDASKYAAGMAQKVAADKAGAASGAAVATAVSQTQTKVSQAGDVLSRLSRQYVDGYASAQKMATAVNQLSRGIETGKIQMTQAGAILDGIARKYGAISSGAEFAARGQTEFAQAIAVTNSRLTAQTVAATHAGTASARLNVAANQNRLSGSQVQGLGYQANDVVTMALMGASPGQIAVSQGGQILQTLQMGEGGLSGSLNAIKASAMAAGASIAAMLGPIGLIAGGFGLAAVAAGAFYLSTREDEKSLEEALGDHAKAVSAIAEAYGLASLKAADFAKSSQIAADAELRRANAALQQSAQTEINNALSQLTVGSAAGGYRSTAQSEYKAFNDAIKQLQNSPQAAENFDKFEQSVHDIVAQNPALQETGDKILGIMDAANKAAHQLDGAAEAIKKIHTFQPEKGDLGGLDLFNLQQQAAHDRRIQQAWADTHRMVAKSPEDIAAAVREQESLKLVAGESALERQDRINIASTTAYGEAEYRLIEAHKQRARALEETLASSRLDLELIGKTTGEQAALRMEFERTQELRQQAAENGIAVDQKELDLIHQKAVEYGKLADAIQKANLLRDIQFEREQLMRSPGEQAIASRLRGTGLGLDSDVAGELRYNQQFAEVRDGVRGFLGDISDALVNGGDDIGKALAQAILGGLNKILDNILDQVLNSLANSITSAIIGTGPSAASGGLDIVGSLFGGAGKGMGGASGGDPWAGLRSAVGGNVGDIIGSGGSNVLLGGSGGGVQGQIWNFFAGKGLAPHQIAGIMGNIHGESAFNPGAVGDSGNALGLFQWNDRKNSMISNVGSDWRGNTQGQLNFAWKEMQGSESQAFNALKGSTSVRGATAAFAGFERPRGFSWGNPEGADNFSGRLKGAEAAFAKFSSTTATATKDIGSLGKVGADATQGLSEFGNGLNSLGSKLGSAGGGGGGGGGSWLSKLFGGLGGGGGGDLGFDGLGGFNGGPGTTDWLFGGWHNYARGGVFAGGNVIPFARGGVVSRPTLFPMANGAGLMGEAGPEAVMPLRRGANGSLGVAMHGGGANVVINSVINNNAGVAVSQEQRKNADGSIDLVTIIEQVIADKANRPGTLMAKALDARGARQQLKRVG